MGKLISLAFICCLLILGISSFVLAKGQSVSFIYNFTDNESYEKELDFSDVLLKVSTEVNAHCKYGLAKGISYEEMEDFDSSLEIIHKKTFLNLGDGIYKYYVRCVDDSENWNCTELEIVLRINARVSAQVVLAESEPLKAGTIEVSLRTSKVVSQAPSLSYSFDGGLVYSPIPLIGSGTLWKGYLSINKNFGEGFVSFKFSANDLEGWEGTKLTSGGVFTIDTIKPLMISEINAIGYDGEIKLDWYFGEDFEEFNVYRSLASNPGYTDFYRTASNTNFIDKWVEDKKTYYYRVSVVDSAGNEGDLSLQVYATSLFENQSYSSGLALELIGRVDNFLVELDLASSELTVIKNSISDKTEKEKELFSYLKLDDEIDKAISELSSLRKGVENYKLLDLTVSELESRIASSRVKMNVIKRKIPEDILIVNEASQKEIIDEALIEELIFELNPLITKKEAGKSLKESLNIIEESGLQIQSNFYLIEIIYSDGEVKELAIIERGITAELEREENTFFVEVIPKDVLESASDINFRNSNYEIVKDDPVISFGTDTKNIFYSFEENVNIDSLKDVKVGLVYLALEEDVVASRITGNFLLDLDTKTSFGVILGIIFLVAIGFYFFYVKRNKLSDFALKLIDKTQQALDSLGRGEIKSAKTSYKYVQKEYKNLDKSEKKEIYPLMELLHDKISVFDLTSGLDKLKETKDKKLLANLEKLYESLSWKHKKMISSQFAKVKIDVLREEKNEA